VICDSRNKRLGENDLPVQLSIEGCGKESARPGGGGEIARARCVTGLSRFTRDPRCQTMVSSGVGVLDKLGQRHVCFLASGA